MSISTDDLFMFDCDWSAFVHLNRDVQEPLFDLAYKLAKTPLAEREEEKKYHLKLISNVLCEEHYLNLIKRTTGDYYYLDDTDEVFGSKTIFTESEITNMDITGFEKIEVKDE